MCRAENNDNIYLTVEVSDAKDVKVEMKDDSVIFSATSQGKDYALDLKLKKKIDAAKSSFATKGRDLEFLLVKAEADQGWWNALLADKNAYKGRCKINWDLWRDEDDVEEKDAGDFGAGGMPGGMGGMPGMGGMGGMGMVRAHCVTARGLGGMT